MLETIIAIAAILLISALIVAYLIRAKKRGKTCIGCPGSCKCDGKCSGECKSHK